MSGGRRALLQARDLPGRLVVAVAAAAVVVFGAGLGVGTLLTGGGDDAVVTVRQPLPASGSSAPSTAAPGASGSSSAPSGTATPGSASDSPSPTVGSAVTAPSVVPVSGGPAPVPRFRCPSSGTRVASAAQLTTALAAAAPGSVILLADGAYKGTFVARARADAQRPVYLCGGRGAVLDGGSTSGGYVLHLDGAAGWRVSGFTVRDGQKGVMVDAGSGNALQDLLVEQTGDEAVHLRRGSTGNVVRGLTIRDTGRRKPKFGEGVYVGTARSNWCDVTGCSPDASDGNYIVENRIGPTTAENVDLKEGTRGGVVAGNVLDGSGLVDADSWVDVKGNDWLVKDNHGSTTPKDGFQTHVILDGWGQDNTFTGNVADLAGGDGVGIYLHKDVPNAVSCTNKVVGGPLSNRSCR